MSESDISKMKVVDLKRELKLRGLLITGNKAELQERLQNAILGGDLSLEDTAISGEGLLEDIPTDEEDKATLTLLPDENELLSSPTSELNTEVPTDTSNDEVAPQAEKIVLKRSSTEMLATSTEAKTDLADVVENGSDSQGTEPKMLKLDEKPRQVIKAPDADFEVKPKQVIKTSALTLEERLQMRAKKFGLDENKVNSPKVNSILTEAGAKNVDPKQIETLKKRAERFGCVVSPTIAKITADERLEKRKQRFGDLLTDSEKTSQVVGKDVYAEKARLRLERFKTPTK